MTRIYVSKIDQIKADDGLSPVRCQVIIWANVVLLLIDILGTYLGEISIEIQTYSFKKLRLEMSSTKWRPFRFGTNVLNIEVLSVLRVLGSLATFFFYQKSTEEHFVNVYCSYRIHLIDLFLIMNIVANCLLRMKCFCHLNSQIGTIFHRTDPRVAPSQWGTSLQSNTVSHWLGANLESATLISLKEFCNY